MPISKVIQERRKTLGLTQEQIAEYLGVTTPAVNKWEKGSTCPDIGLLAPLARLLKTDLNTLFGFSEDITRQELVLFCKEIHETVISNGFEAGFQIAQVKIREYPNNDMLLHNLVLQLQGLLATSGLDEMRTNEYLKKIDAWYERLTESDDVVIRNSAYYMLASRAISEKQYKVAQSYLDQMPNRNDTPDKRMLQAAIYLNQDKSEEAASLLERTLLTAISDVQMVLYRLIDANIALGDMDTAAYVAERVSILSKTFDLNQYNTLVGPFQMAVAKKDVTKTIEILKKMLNTMTHTWTMQVSPLYRRIETNNSGTSMEKMITPLLQRLRQSPEYAYLQDNEDFLALLRDFEDKVN